MRGWLLGALVCPAMLCASPAQVCLQDCAGLPPPAAAAFYSELGALLNEPVRKSCEPGSVTVTIRFEAPGRYATALGLAWKTPGRILPQVEVYLNPVLRALNHVRASGVVGRALARVAAHEILHYRLQRAGHDDAGLFAPVFSPAALR